MGQFCPVGDWSDRTVPMWLHAAHSHSKELKQNMTIIYSNQEQFVYFICNCPLVISSVSLIYFSIKGANPMGGVEDLPCEKDVGAHLPFWGLTSSFGPS